MLKKTSFQFFSIKKKNIKALSLEPGRAGAQAQLLRREPGVEGEVQELLKIYLKKSGRGVIMPARAEATIGGERGVS